MLAGEPVGLPIGGEEQVVGRVEMASGDEDGEVGAGCLQALCCMGHVGPYGDWQAGESGQLVQIGGDAGDERQKSGSEQGESVWVEQFPAGAGAEYRIEDDGNVGVLGLEVEEEVGDGSDGGCVGQHSQLDATGG